MAKGNNSNANRNNHFGFKVELRAADKTRGHMDASEYKQVCLGLIFLNSNYTTWKLARMNLAIRGIDANFGPRNADSFRADLHLGLKVNFVPVQNLATG